MGPGKLRSPARGGASSTRDSAADEPSESAANPGPLRIAELVSELLYAGRTLAEVAGYDDLQLSQVVFRPRDKYGRLVRGEGLPPGVEVDEDGMRVVTAPVAFSAMFRQVKGEQGVGREEAARQWQEFLRVNPKFGLGGE